MQYPVTAITEYPDGNYIAGACKSDYRTIKCGRFLWPATSAQLQNMCCPTCGNLLSQTSRHSSGRWFWIAGDVARSIAGPRKRARTAAKQAENAALAAFAVEQAEPERGTSDWYSWHNRRYFARTRAYDNAFQAALSRELAVSA